MLQIGNCYVIDFSKVSDRNIFNLNVKSRDKKRYIDLQLVDSNNVINLSSYTVVVRAEKSDGNMIFNDVVKTTPSEGRSRLEITQQMLSIDDKLPCEIILYGSDGTIASTSDFTLNIINSPHDEKIISSNEFTALEEALKTTTEISNMKSDLDSVKLPNMNLKESLDYTFINTRKADISNLNTTVKPGVYSVGASYIIPGTPLNEPMYGTLLVLSRRGNEVQQVFITIDGVIYLRYYDYRGQWNTWTKVASFKDGKLQAYDLITKNFYGSNGHLFLTYDEKTNQLRAGNDINLNGFRIVGGTMVGLNLSRSTTTFNLKDNHKAKSALLAEDFSKQNKQNDEITVSIDDIIKHLYLKNIELENEINRLKDTIDKHGSGDSNVK